MNDPFVRRLRAAAASALPPGAFLRRDRGDALFVTDAARRGASIGWAALGFLCDTRDGLERLTPDARWLRALAEAHPLPPDHLTATLSGYDGPIPTDTLKLFARGCKRLEGAPDPGWDKALRQHIARALREHRNDGGLYACALLRYNTVLKDDPEKERRT